MIDSNLRICVVGLGYVGLPVAVHLSGHFQVIGYDIDHSRIEELRKHYDRTGEISAYGLKTCSVRLTEDSSQIKECDVYIITVPTPVNEDKSPNLNPLKNASELVGSVIGPLNLVIYESTVYPGATRDFCGGILVKESGLKISMPTDDQSVTNKFYLAYSPERINPGDPSSKFENLNKVISASCADGLELVERIYSKVLKGTVHRATTLEVAEASKLIENIQRDVNIALMNELQQVFTRLNLDLPASLAAAATKWNFLNFKPGLVGGHCIGVDPYYLAHKAITNGIHTPLILMSRQINDNMVEFYSLLIQRRWMEKAELATNRKVLFLGMTFKENVPDTRNSLSFALVDSLTLSGFSVDVYDPFLASNSDEDFKSESNENFDRNYALVILCVPHSEFTSLPKRWYVDRMEKHGILFDLKNALPFCINGWFEAESDPVES